MCRLQSHPWALWQNICYQWHIKTKRDFFESPLQLEFHYMRQICNVSPGPRQPEISSLGLSRLRTRRFSPRRATRCGNRSDPASARDRLAWFSTKSTQWGPACAPSQSGSTIHISNTTLHYKTHSTSLWHYWAQAEGGETIISKESVFTGIFFIIY